MRNQRWRPVTGSAREIAYIKSSHVARPENVGIAVVKLLLLGTQAEIYVILYPLPVTVREHQRCITGTDSDVRVLIIGLLGFLTCKITVSAGSSPILNEYIDWAERTFIRRLFPARVCD